MTWECPLQAEIPITEITEMEIRMMAATKEGAIKIGTSVTIAGTKTIQEINLRKARNGITVGVSLTDAEGKITAITVAKTPTKNPCLPISSVFSVAAIIM